MLDLLDAVRLGDITRVNELLAGGADVNQAGINGFTDLIRDVFWSRYSLAQLLLVEGGASIDQGTTGIWRLLNCSNIWHLLHGRTHTIKDDNSREFSAFLKVTVLLSDAPQFFISKLLPHDADICTRGRLLRAQLPSYLEQQRALVISHCPLPTVLQSLVAEYAVTTPEDIWTDGLRVQEPQPKRVREAVAVDDEGKENGEPPPRRSVRLRQKRG
jgi:hypothetical protein